MAWTTPRDWTAGELVTEAIMDTHVKDNLNETAPAKAATTGRIIRVVDTNSIEEVGGVALIGNATADGAGGTLIVSNIPTDYKHLRFMVSGEHDGTTSTIQTVGIRLNADSGSNYRWLRNETDDNANIARSSDITPDNQIEPGGAPGLTNGYLLEGTILNYSASAARHIVKFHGAIVAGAGAGAHTSFEGMGVWEPSSADAVDQITIRILTDNWASGTVLSVYGYSV